MENIIEEVKRDPAYFRLLSKNNPGEAGRYLDKYNLYLSSLGSTTKTWEEAKANGENSVVIKTSTGTQEVQIPTEKEEVKIESTEEEEITLTEVTTEPETMSVTEFVNELKTKEEKIDFLKQNGHPLANANWKDETIDAKIAEITK
jgi:predicted HTH domain antitoxin